MPVRMPIAILGIIDDRRPGTKTEKKGLLEELDTHRKAQEDLLKRFSEDRTVLLGHIREFKEAKEKHDAERHPKRKLMLKAPVKDSFETMLWFARKASRDFKNRLEEYEKDGDPKVRGLALWFQQCPEFDKIEAFMPGAVIDGTRMAKEFEEDDSALYWEMRCLRDPAEGTYAKEQSRARIVNFARKMPDACAKRLREYRTNPKAMEDRKNAPDTKAMAEWFEGSEYYQDVKKYLPAIPQS